MSSGERDHIKCDYCGLRWHAAGGEPWMKCGCNISKIGESISRDGYWICPDCAANHNSPHLLIRHAYLMGRERGIIIGRNEVFSELSEAYESLSK